MELSEWTVRFSRGDNGWAWIARHPDRVRPVVGKGSRLKADAESHALAALELEIDSENSGPVEISGEDLANLVHRRVADTARRNVEAKAIALVEAGRSGGGDEAADAAIRLIRRKP